MTFEEFWKEHSGYHVPGDDLGGTAEYDLAAATWDAATESAREEAEAETEGEKTCLT